MFSEREWYIDYFARCCMNDLIPLSREEFVLKEGIRYSQMEGLNAMSISDGRGLFWGHIFPYLIQSEEGRKELIKERRKNYEEQIKKYGQKITKGESLKFVSLIEFLDFLKNSEARTE